MAATEILAPGTTGASATAVDVTTTPVSVGLYVASGELPDNARARVHISTPGAAVLVLRLDKDNPVRALTAPGTYTVVRPSNPNGVSIGVFRDPAA